MKTTKRKRKQLKLKESKSRTSKRAKIYSLKMYRHGKNDYVDKSC